MSPHEACLSAEQLRHWVSHALSAEDAAAVARHLENCSRCTQAASALQLQPTLLQATPAVPETLPCANAVDFGASAPRTEAPIAGVEHGRFTVLQSHARGGLGEVFLALDQQLNREVALKQIQAEYARDPDSRHRFLLEAEITGRLEHPGIVPVYARGHYEDGRLYYAMRFIRGESLKENIDRFHAADAHPRREPGERALALRKLLARFIEVCNALAYAHSRGVVHRDIKPSNIMLGPYGETLVVDWGLAKLMGVETTAPEPSEGSLPPLAASSSSSTQMGVAMGTPAYMSPEQAMGYQPHVGPASDIYSLGAMLYELLAGQQPFGSNPRGNMQDVFRQIMAGQFPPPRKVNPRVPPPLEAICLKAMAAERENRYATARELADDVEAWLADEPVRAWREPWTVRQARWRRRHRPLVAGLATAAAALGASLALGVALLYSANQRIASERDRAELNFTQLRQASNEMMEVIEQWLSRSPEAASVQQALLRKGLQFYEQFLQQAPTNTAVRAEMAANHQRVADIRRLLGQYDLAAQHSQQARDEFAALASLEPRTISHRRGWAESSNWLGEAYRLGGKSGEARQAYEEAIRLGQQLQQERPTDEARGDLARAHYNLGLLLHGGGQMAEAEQAFRTAIGLLDGEIAATPSNSEPRQHLARCHINLGILLKDTNRPLEADAEYRQAIALLERLADDAPEDAELHFELGVARMDRGNLLFVRRDEPRLADGQPLSEALASYEAAIGILAPLAVEYPSVPRYRKELAGSYNGLGSARLVQNDLEKARQAWQQARQQQEALVAAAPKLAGYHSALGLTLGNLALIARRDNEADAAQRLLEDAIARQADAARLDEGNVSYPRFLNNHRRSLARLHVSQGAHAQAAEQSDLIQAAAGDWQESWRAAQLLSQCARAAARDEALDEAARNSAVDAYGRRAVKRLQQAIDWGLNDAMAIEADPELKPLHERADYRQLIARLKEPAASKP